MVSMIAAVLGRTWCASRPPVRPFGVQYTGTGMPRYRGEGSAGRTSMTASRFRSTIASSTAVRSVAVGCLGRAPGSATGPG